MITGPALLFCPADRPDRYAKAAAAADTVILDLEDAVAPADKQAARESLTTTLLDPDRTIVRVNPARTPDHQLDVEAVRRSPYRTIMLAKAEHTSQLDGLEDFELVALCETAFGILNVREIASDPRIAAVMWGAEDLIASMEGRSSRKADGTYRDVARVSRAQVLLAARAYGKLALDSVYLNIPDTDGLRAEVEDAAASGFSATVCIHPSQAEVIRAGYASSDDEREWAEAVIEEARNQPGVFRFRGRMIDEPVLRQARKMLADG